jgi:LAO/AO transport system kinase
MPRFRHSPQTYIEGVLAHDRVILSQAITLIESNLPQDEILAQEVLTAILPYTSKSVRIGITGVPGVGKSTFIEAFGVYMADNGGKVAVLAIDPSSQRNKGSILGDKTRMEKLATHPNAYIRPTPSQATLGGVARRTRETMLLCEAGGFDTILIETVGVGQSETLVRSMVDFFLLLMLAGAGDELQGMKRGIMEMADALVITKADGANQQQAKRAAKEYENALHLFPPAPSGWITPVLLTSALSGEGINEVWQTITNYLQHTQNKYSSENLNHSFFQQQRAQQQLAWLHESIQYTLEQLFYQNPSIRSALPTLETQVAENMLLPTEAVKKLLQNFIPTFQG